MRRLFLALLLVLAFNTVGCDVVSAPSPWVESSFTVAPGERHTVAVPLGGGHRLEGSFSVSGAEDYIDFYIKGPTGAIPYGVVRAEGGHNFSIKAEGTGAYVLYFDNAFSFGSSRDISLRYRTR